MSDNVRWMKREKWKYLHVRMHVYQICCMEISIMYVRRNIKTNRMQWQLCGKIQEEKAQELIQDCIQTKYMEMFWSVRIRFHVTYIKDDWMDWEEWEDWESCNWIKLIRLSKGKRWKMQRTKGKVRSSMKIWDENEWTLFFKIKFSIGHVPVIALSWSPFIFLTFPGNHTWKRNVVFPIPLQNFSGTYLSQFGFSRSNGIQIPQCMLAGNCIYWRVLNDSGKLRQACLCDSKMAKHFKNYCSDYLSFSGSWHVSVVIEPFLHGVASLFLSLASLGNYRPRSLKRQESHSMYFSPVAIKDPIHQWLLC